MRRVHNRIEKFERRAAVYNEPFRDANPTRVQHKSCERGTRRTKGSAPKPHPPIPRVKEKRKEARSRARSRRTSRSRRND